MCGLLLALLLLVLPVGRAASHPGAPPILDSEDVLAAAKTVNEYALQHVVSARNDQPLRGKGCQWTRSTYMVGLAEYYAATASARSPDLRARAFLSDWGEEFSYQLCRAAAAPWTGPCAPTNASLGPALGCGDNQLCGAVYIELYKQGLDRPAPRSASTLQATVAQFDAEIALGKQTDGSWHVIDVTYMAMAPLSRLGALTGLQKYFDKQWANWRSSMLEPPSRSADGACGLWNATDRLFHRDGTKLGTAIYWGRGNGWAMLGLVDALRWGDAVSVKGGSADPHRGSYLVVYKEFAERLLELQGADGAWRSSLLDSEHYPTPETSSTACFTHGLAYGVNAGILEKSAFAPVRRKSPLWLPFAFKNDQFAKTGSGQTQEKLSKKAVRVLHAGGAKSLGLFDEGRGAEQYRTAGILPATRRRSCEC
jgi:rhamnogalacturonyl hydrolase YesR